MNGLKKLSLSLALAVAVTACSKGGDNQAPPVLPIQPMPNHINGQYPGNGNINQNGLIPPAPPINPFSQDITYDGSIVNRQLRIISGATYETVEDNCVNALYREQYRGRWWQMDISRQNMILNFDQNGQLTIIMKSPNGEAVSSPGISYFLNSDPSVQALEISSFTLSGAPSPMYISKEMNRGRYAQMMSYRQPVDSDYVSGRWSSMPTYNYGTPPFAGNFQGSTPMGPNGFGGGTNGFVTGGNPNDPNNSAQGQSTLFVKSEGLRITLITTRSDAREQSAQHIFAGMINEGAKLQTQINIVGSTNGCYTNVDTEMRGRMQ